MDPESFVPNASTKIKENPNIDLPIVISNVYSRYDIDLVPGFTYTEPAVEPPKIMVNPAVTKLKDVNIKVPPRVCFTMLAAELNLISKFTNELQPEPEPEPEPLIDIELEPGLTVTETKVQTKRKKFSKNWNPWDIPSKPFIFRLKKHFAHKPVKRTRLRRLAEFDGVEVDENEFIG